MAGRPSTGAKAAETLRRSNEAIAERFGGPVPGTAPTSILGGPQPVAMPDWLAKLPDASRRWQVVNLDTGQSFGPYLKCPPQEEVDALDGGNRHRFEIREYREQVTARGREWRPFGGAKLYQPDSSGPTVPPPGAGNGDAGWGPQAIWQMATSLGRIEHHLSSPAGRGQALPPNPYMLPTGEAAVPQSSLAAVREDAERRIRSAQDEARRALESADRDHDRAMKALESQHASSDRILSGRIQELERQAGRHEEEVDRLRRRLTDAEDERDRLDTELRTANRSIRDLEADLDAARARAAAMPLLPSGAATAVAPEDDLERLAGTAKRVGKLAEVFGYKKGDEAGDGEPLDVRKLRGYTEVAEAAMKGLVDVVQEWRKPGTGPNGAPTPPASPPKLKILVELLASYFRNGRTPGETFVALAPLVPPEARSALAVLPREQFVADAIGATTDGDPLRSAAGRVWLQGIHALLSGQGPAPSPPAVTAPAQAPLLAPPARPVVPPSFPSAPAAPIGSPPPSTQSPEAFTGRRVKDAIEELRASAPPGPAPAGTGAAPAG